MDIEPIDGDFNSLNGKSNTNLSGITGITGVTNNTSNTPTTKKKRKNKNKKKTKLLIQPREISTNSYEIGSYYDIIERELGRKSPPEKQGYADDFMRQLGDSNFKSAGSRNIKFRAPLTPYGGAPVPRRRNKKHKDVCKLHPPKIDKNSEYQVGAGNNFDLSFFQGDRQHSDMGSRGDGMDDLSGDEENLRAKRKQFFYEFEFDDGGEETVDKAAARERALAEFEAAIELRRKNRKKKRYSIYGSNADFNDDTSYKKPPPGVIKKLRKDRKIKKRLSKKSATGGGRPEGKYMKTNSADSRMTEEDEGEEGERGEEEDDDEFNFGSIISPPTLERSSTMTAASLSHVRMSNQVYPSSASSDMMPHSGEHHGGPNHHHGNHQHHAGMFGHSPSSLPISYTNSSKSLLSNRSTPITGQGDEEYGKKRRSQRRRKTENDGIGEEDGGISTEYDAFGARRGKRGADGEEGEEDEDEEDYDDNDEGDSEGANNLNDSRHQRKHRRKGGGERHYGDMYSSSDGKASSTAGSKAGLFGKTRKAKQRNGSGHYGGGDHDSQYDDDEDHGHHHHRSHDKENENYSGNANEKGKRKNINPGSVKTIDDKKDPLNRNRTGGVAVSGAMDRNDTKYKRSNKTAANEDDNYDEDEYENEVNTAAGIGAAGGSNRKDKSDAGRRGIRNQGSNGKNKTGGAGDRANDSTEKNKAVAGRAGDSSLLVAQRLNRGITNNGIHDSNAGENNEEYTNAEDEVEELGGTKGNKKANKSFNQSNQSNNQNGGISNNDLKKSNNNKANNNEDEVSRGKPATDVAKTSKKEEKNYSVGGLIGKFLKRNNNKSGDKENNAKANELAATSTARATEAAEDAGVAGAVRVATGANASNALNKSKDGTVLQNENGLIMSRSGTNNSEFGKTRSIRSPGVENGVENMGYVDENGNSVAYANQDEANRLVGQSARLAKGQTATQLQQQQKQQGRASAQRKNENKAGGDSIKDESLLESDKQRLDPDIESISLDDSTREKKKKSRLEKWGGKKVKGCCCLNNRRRVACCLSLLGCLCCLLLLILAIVLMIVLLYAFYPCLFTKCASNASTCINRSAFKAQCICDYGYGGDGSTYCDECGLVYEAPNVKVLGGVNAVSYSWPATIFILFQYTSDVNVNGNITKGYTYSLACEGVLIDRTTVITVAHCITNEFMLKDSSGNNYTFQVTTNSYNPTVGSMYTVYVAEYDLDYYDQSPATSYSVKTAFRHSSYDSVNALYDIGMIKLNSQVSLNNYVQIACLPSRTINYYPTSVNMTAYVAGWGDMYDNGTYAWILQNAKIMVYDNSYCYNVVSYVTKNWNTQLCAGNLTGGVDTCQGDSGSALYVSDSINGKTKNIAAGLTSYGQSCGKANLPGVYTRTSYFSDWINYQKWLNN